MKEAIQRAISNIDHLLIGTPRLDETVARFSEFHGVQPVYGGSHPAHGTSNYLISLGDRCYLEFIGPTEFREADPLNTIVRGLSGERLIGLAFASANLDATVNRAKELSLVLGPTQSDTRETPDGNRLSWRLALFDPAVFHPLLFFAIEWGEGSHPSLKPSTVRLAGLEITAPNPLARTYLRDLMKSDAPLRSGSPVRLTCAIASGAGTAKHTSDAPPEFVRT